MVLPGTQHGPPDHAVREAQQQQVPCRIPPHAAPALHACCGTWLLPWGASAVALSSWKTDASKHCGSNAYEAKH